MNDQAPADISIGMVVFASAFAGLLGWGLLAVLERFAAARARLIWRIIALLVLLLSLGGPLSGTGIAGGNRLALAAMHVAVAVVLIPLLPGAWRRARVEG